MCLCVKRRRAGESENKIDGFDRKSTDACQKNNKTIDSEPVYLLRNRPLMEVLLHLIKPEVRKVTAVNYLFITAAIFLELPTFALSYTYSLHYLS